MSSDEIRVLRQDLLLWYSEKRRDLPWRATRDPYRVWVSEIMLQQTRVAAVLDHYRRFLEAFPTVEALARATDHDVLALWSGLGYYRRARMMHKAAQVIVAERGGLFPQTAKELRELPGIGRYTSAAIASIAFGEPVAAVDGNVERVLSRMLGRPLTPEEYWTEAQALIDPQHAGEWNQAMMELGAVVCTPQSPQCLLCPVGTHCKAPGAETRKPQAPRQRREVRLALMRKAESVYLVQRAPDAKKMAGMWELPEATHTGEELCSVRHSITNTDYRVTVVKQSARYAKQGQWWPVHKRHELALTGLTRKVLKKLIPETVPADAATPPQSPGLT